MHGHPSTVLRSIQPLKMVQDDLWMRHRAQPDESRPSHTLARDRPPLLLPSTNLGSGMVALSVQVFVVSDVEESDCFLVLAVLDDPALLLVIFVPVVCNDARWTASRRLREA